MAARFNPPPGWPPAPEGWTPPVGWAPDPSWTPPPPGWQLWIDDAAPLGAPVPVPAGQPDVARFAGPDSPAPTQVFPAAGGHAPFEKQPDAAPAHFGAPAPAQGGFGAPSIPPSGGWQGGPAAPSGPRSGKQWLIPVIIAIVAIAAIIGVLFATGVLGGGDDPKDKPTSSTSKKTDEATDKASDKATDEPTDKATDAETAKPTNEPTDAAPATGNNGTRAVPLAPGELATFTSWTIAMGAANLDAWPEISATEDDYYAPEAGFVYVMAPATVAFTGSDRSSVSDLDWVFVSTAGTTFDDQCGYASLPSELDKYQELYTGASATGNVCVTVPAAEVAGGVWRVESWSDYKGDSEGYFAIS